MKTIERPIVVFVRQDGKELSSDAYMDMRIREALEFAWDSLEEFQADLNATEGYSPWNRVRAFQLALEKALREGDHDFAEYWICPRCGTMYDPDEGHTCEEDAE